MSVTFTANAAIGFRLYPQDLVTSKSITRRSCSCEVVGRPNFCPTCGKRLEEIVTEYALIDEDIKCDFDPKTGDVSDIRSINGFPVIHMSYGYGEDIYVVSLFSARVDGDGYEKDDHFRGEPFDFDDIPRRARDLLSTMPRELYEKSGVGLWCGMSCG